MRIAIVGAGLIGRLCAWHLCQTDHKIHLFEQSASISNQTCSYAAGALLGPYSEIAVLGQQWFEKANVALHCWPTIINSLGLPVYYKMNGTELVASFAHRSLLDNAIANIQYHLPHFVAPNIEKSNDHWRYVLTEEGHLNPRELLAGLAEFVKCRGVTWHIDTVQTLQPYVLTTNTKEWHFDWIIDCRGLGAKMVLPDLRGVRGELVLCYAPQVTISRAIRFFHPNLCCYIVPQGQQQYVIGATQMESESRQPIYLKSMLQLMTAAMLVDPRFKDAHILDTKIGLRPTTQTQLPFVHEVSGLTVINGFFRHGFLLAPALVQTALLSICEGINQ